MVCARAPWGLVWNGWLYSSANRGMVPKSGIRRDQTQGENSVDRFWWHWNSLRGWEGGAPQLGTLLEKAHIALEVRFNCWVAHKGQSHHCGLFSHTSAPGFWGTGKDSQKREHVRLSCSLLISLLPHARPSPHVPWSPLLGPLTQIWKHAPHSCRAGDKIRAEPQGLWH